MTALHTAERRRPGLWQTLRPLLLRLHFYVGIFVGPFILLAAVTGILYALTPQLEQVVHREQLRVEVGEQRVPLAEQVRIGQLAVPDGTLSQVRVAEDPTATTRIVFDSPTAPPDRTLTAFVDPWTGELTGVLPTSGEWLPLRSWFDELHRSLLLGDVGRIYSELAASWLWVLALSGIALWLFRVRRRAVRDSLVPRRSGSGRVRTLSWHATIGLWAGLGLLFLSATGLTWSQFAGANVSTLRAALDWNTPTVATNLDSPPVPPDAEAATVAQVLDVARADGIDGAVAITPGADGQAWTITRTQRSWPTRQDSVAIDPVRLQVVDRIDFADWPVAAKLARWGIDAHMGLLFGVANQIALIALAAGIITMIILGYRMWWQRRPGRSPRETLPAPPATAGRVGPLTRERVDPRAAMAVGVIAVVVGVLAPVLGGSLLCFLAFDVIRTTLPGARR